ncbi:MULTISPECIES: transcriptional regulator NrdR [unclassified Ectothiorhodospira]|uniref:transcriptional regulator NrdR n=1 Tax=unclassified Ectothiorhodospira TaxID=2684909 RepID=UPI001EE7D34A|nr:MULTISPECIES: transcriptional regulator NrdR [unclassified Ectothiorhodospira]MCG5516600.1 transcriptional regulator NrdR [Ectothiorhodospira sp. 9100]MCG5520238.1 transcriptional regulator NrdR [Ectothiorhodospira sp. 9905]
MKCPYCGAPDTRVVDSRLAGEGEQVRRRRECAACGDRFTTFEGAELNLPRVVKRDGGREPFNEGKLRAGVMHALEKRPVPTDRVEAALTRIKHKAMSQGERELPAQRIGEWVMEELQGLDQVAYIRFASVYLSFADVQAFREVVERLEKDPQGNKD